MQPIWLIETGVWQDGNDQRIIDYLNAMCIPFQAEEYTYLGGREFEIIDADRPVIFYGSINTSEYLSLTHKDWVPLIWFDEEKYSCRSYFTHWGKFILQEHYGFYPLAELVRLRKLLYQTYAVDDYVFIRPDDNDKSFTGKLVPTDVFSQWYKETQSSKVSPETLVLVSAPVTIQAEWRFVIADRKVITGTYYKGSSNHSIPGNAYQEAEEFAGHIANSDWQPRAIYCVDIGYTEAGMYRLVEMGGINSAGLYRCNVEPIVKAMNEIAVREYRLWKGMH